MLANVRCIARMAFAFIHTYSNCLFYSAHSFLPTAVFHRFGHSSKAIGIRAVVTDFDGAICANADLVRQHVDVAATKEDIG